MVWSGTTLPLALILHYFVIINFISIIAVISQETSVSP
jgi:hypothetical protein